MNKYVADTHGLYWYLTASPKLGPEALSAFLEGERGEAVIYIPSIVVAELYYLNATIGFPLNFAAEFDGISRASQFVFTEFTAEDVLQFGDLVAIPEMHDRIIAGTSRSIGCGCITRDPLIIASGLVPVVW